MIALFTLHDRPLPLAEKDGQRGYWCAQRFVAVEPIIVGETVEAVEMERAAMLEGVRRYANSA